MNKVVILRRDHPNLLFVSSLNSFFVTLSILFSTQVNSIVGSSPEKLVQHFFIQLLFFVRCENLYLMFSRLPSLLLMNLMCYVDFPVHFLVFLVSLLILLFLTNFFYPPHQLERRNPLLIFSTFNCQHTSTFMTSTIANPRLFFTKVDG